VTRLVMVVSHKSKNTRQPKGKDCCILFKNRLEPPDIVSIETDSIVCMRK
jgi:hypothetical protein